MRRQVVAALAAPQPQARQRVLEALRRLGRPLRVVRPTAAHCRLIGREVTLVRGAPAFHRVAVLVKRRGGSARPVEAVVLARRGATELAD